MSESAAFTNTAQTLMDMGFHQKKIEKALRVKGANVESAMEWLLSNNGTEDFEDDSSDDDGESTVKKVEVKKELTDEEKAQKLQDLEKLRVMKRKEREKEERLEREAKERNRIREGKAIGDIKAEMAEKEMRKAAEERRREKVETQKAKERVRAQIEEDKRARKAKFTNATPTVSSKDETSAGDKKLQSPVKVTPTEKKEYTETRIQIRLTNGNTLTQTFKTDETLAAVRLYIEMNRTDLVPVDCALKLMTNFPKKIFTEDDFNATLTSLDLVPSAVIIVSK